MPSFSLPEHIELEPESLPSAPLLAELRERLASGDKEIANESLRLLVKLGPRAAGARRSELGWFYVQMPIMDPPALR